MTRRSRTASSLAALVLALTVPAVALAHAELESATPGPDDEVVGSPTVLIATFSEDLDPSRTSLVVVDSSGATVAQGGELGADVREFRLDLPALVPGVYEVRWTSFSADDNELDRGTYTFTVLAAPTPSPAAATPAPTAPPDDQGAADTLGILLPIGAVLLVAAAVGVWLVRRQRA